MTNRERARELFRVISAMPPANTIGDAATITEIERALDAAVREEREACAALVEPQRRCDDAAMFCLSCHTFQELAKAIRARGEVKP